jgi:hypothetical protein
MGKIVKSSKLNRLWKNGILPFKNKVDNPISSYDDMMSNTVPGYMLDPLAAKDGFNEVKKHLFANDETGIPIIQALYNNDYGAVRLQTSTLDDPNPSINMYRKYNKSDASFERALSLYFDDVQQDFYVLGKTKDKETVKRKLGGRINGAGGTITKTITESVNVKHKTFTDICSVDIPAGKWLVIGNIRYAPNATGGRTLAMHTTSQWSGIERSMKSIGTIQDSISHAKYMQSSTDFKLILIGYQDSGADLSVTSASIQAVRLD